MSDTVYKMAERVRECSARRINPFYADKVSPSTQVQALAALAFQERWPDHEDALLIRECLRRLDEDGSLSRPDD